MKALSQWTYILHIQVLAPVIIMDWLFHADHLKPTSSMGSIILYSVALGLHIPGLRGGKACERPSPSTTAVTNTGSVNWYQRNYLFAWAGARVVRDL